VEDPEHLLLKWRLHVNENVAARDQIDARKRRVSAQILGGEHDHVADLATDLKGVVLFREEPLEAPGRHVELDVRPVDAIARLPDGVFVEIGREDLDGILPGFVSQMLEQTHRQRVGFFAGRAAGHRDANGRAGGAAVEHLRKDDGIERLEDGAVAKEVGDADEKIPVEELELGAIFLDVSDVLVDAVRAVHGHPPLDASLEGAVLVLGEVDAERSAKLTEDPREALLVQAAGGPGANDVRGGC